MSTVPKSRTLYKTPFSSAYWLDALAELKDVRMLVFAALMIAVRVALKPVYIPLAPNLRINTAFVATAIGSMTFGPVVAALAAIVSDLLGVMMTGEPYFPPMVLTEIAGSVIFALFLYRARLTPTRVILSRFCICLFVNILLQTPLMMLYYQVMMGGKSYVLTVPSILKNLLMFPVESVVLTLLLSVIQPVTCRMKLTYNGDHALRFTKKQLVLLGATFLVGCCCVFWYLGYHYDHTSITTGYSAQEVIDQNKRMDTIIREQTGGIEGEAVAVIESAYKKFLDDDVNYTVAYYAVAPGTFEESLWSLKKTPASKKENLTRQGTARIHIDEDTGTIVSFEYTPEG